MSQLVIRPGMALPLGIGAQRGAFSTAVRRIHGRWNLLVAAAMAVIGRAGARVLDAGEAGPRLEPPYFEAARMSREMYRL